MPSRHTYVRPSSLPPDDLFDSKQFTTYQPSPIATINGFDATAYLSDFAAKNAVGSLEAHAEWNQLMLSPVLDILGSLDVFSGAATFNPGDELILKFQNGTELKTRWLAFYNSQGATGPLQTGGDFYNYFVLGLLPASYDASAPNGDPGLATVSTSEATPTPTVASTSTAATTTPTVTPGWNNSAFPAVPDVAQADLGTFGGGFVSGYFYHTDSLGVLSIPSFEAKGNELDTFKAAIAEFVTKSKAAGLKRVLIDVQQNTGGNAFLAYDTFRHFFPNIDPFDGSRMRAHDSGNVMGEALTGYWNGLNDTEDDYYSLAANEWVATSRINVETGRNFTSWAEFYGPHAERGDFATTTARYNLSSSIFSESGTRTDDFTVYAYPDDPAAGVATPPYAAEDILILSDGICDSACALLVEMLHHEAGVRTVAVGGLPAPGPMQVPGGSRGARYYSISTLDDNIAAVQSFLRSQGSANATFLPNRTEALNIELLYASVNLRDQIRRGETVPVQFAYEAADCRVYYTPRTVYNQTALWLDAAAALWSSPQRCVAGSTGFATTGTAATDFVGPASAVAPSRAGVFNLTAHLDPARPAVPDGGDGVLACGGLRPCNSAEVERCNADQDCGPNRACRPFDACQGGGQVAPVKQCVPTCKANLISCPGGATCQLQQGTCVKVGSQNACDGICVPPPVQQRCGPGKVQGKVVLSPAPPVKRRDAGR